jgi:hypothetical protein
MSQRDIAKAITAMGTGLGPDVLTACRALFDAEQRAGLWRPVPAISPMARMKGTG